MADWKERSDRIFTAISTAGWLGSWLIGIPVMGLLMGPHMGSWVHPHTDETMPYLWGSWALGTFCAWLHGRLDETAN